MTAQTAAIKDQVMAAVLAGDHAVLRGLLHPAFEMRQASALPYAGTYTGPEGFIRFVALFLDTYDLTRLEAIETFTAPSGSLVVELAIEGRSKATGGRLETTLLEKWDFADGKVLRISPHYFDPALR